MGLLSPVAKGSRLRWSGSAGLDVGVAAAVAVGDGDAVGVADAGGLPLGDGAAWLHA